MRMTHRPQRLFAFALLLLPACASSTSPELAPAISSARQEMTALMERDKVPGAVIAVTEGDHIVWHEAFGLADLSTKAPVTLDSRFRVGSLSKMMTVAALMRLVDRGAVALDEPVSRYLPSYPHGEITLRQLAGHLSGIRHYRRDEFLNRTHYNNVTESLSRFAADPLLSPPGDKYFYSTYGYDVLGAVIEKVTGSNFDAAMRSLLFVPLGMTSTSFESDERTVSFYDAGKEGPERSPEVDLTDRLPAGAAVTTADDLARLLMAMSSPSFLSDASRRTIATSQMTNDGKPTSVGIGWRIAKDGKGRLFLHHGGAVTGGRAFLLFYPNERVGVAIVSNLGFAQFNEKQAGAIAAGFLDRQARQ